MKDQPGCAIRNGFKDSKNGHGDLLRKYKNDPGGRLLDQVDNIKEKSINSKKCLGTRATELCDSLDWVMRVNVTHQCEFSDDGLDVHAV